MDEGFSGRNADCRAYANTPPPERYPQSALRIPPSPLLPLPLSIRPDISATVPDHETHAGKTEARPTMSAFNPPRHHLTVGQILSEIHMYTHTQTVPLESGDTCSAVVLVSITMDSLSRLQVDLGPSRFSSFFAAQPVRDVSLHPCSKFSRPSRQASRGASASVVAGTAPAPGMPLSGDTELGITFLFSSFVDALAVELRIPTTHY